MAAEWISIPKVEGNASRQAHCDLPKDTFEREMGKEGFYGPSTQFHHYHPPTSWSKIEGPLRPRAFDSTKLSNLTECPWQAPLLLSNKNILVRIWKTNSSMNHLVRNGDGDELLFVHQGNGDLFCDFGHMQFSEGDYIMLPRGTMWRIETQNALSLLMIEASNNSYQLPEKGVVGNHAIFDAAMLDTPCIDQAFIAQQNEVDWRVVVKRRRTLSTITYPFNPLMLSVGTVHFVRSVLICVISGS